MKNKHKAIVIVVASVVLIAIIGIIAFATGDNSKSSQTSESSEIEIKYEEVTETELIPFGESQEEDSNLEEGTNNTKQEGVDGEKELVYKIKLVDGKEESREKISETTTREPVEKIVVVGTKAGNVAGATTQESTPPPVSTPPPASTPAPSGYSCSGKTTCGQMSTCEEAYFYMNSCGISRLDGDKDGVPCESICR